MIATGNTANLHAYVSRMRIGQVALIEVQSQGYEIIKISATEHAHRRVYPNEEKNYGISLDSIVMPITAMVEIVEGSGAQPSAAVPAKTKSVCDCELIKLLQVGCKCGSIEPYKGGLDHA